MAWTWRRCLVRRDSIPAVGLGPTPSSSAAIGFRKGDAVVPIISPVWCSAARIYVVKPLGLVSFGTRIRQPAGRAVALDRQRKLAGERNRCGGTLAGSLEPPYKYGRRVTARRGASA